MTLLGGTFLTLNSGPQSFNSGDCWPVGRALPRDFLGGWKAGLGRGEEPAHVRRRRLQRLGPVCGDRAVTVIFPSNQPLPGRSAR